MHGGSIFGHKQYKMFDIKRNRKGKLIDLIEDKQVGEMASDKLPGEKPQRRGTCNICGNVVFESEMLKHFADAHPKDLEKFLGFARQLGESMGVRKEFLDKMLEKWMKGEMVLDDDQDV